MHDVPLYLENILHSSVLNDKSYNCIVNQNTSFSACSLCLLFVCACVGVGEPLYMKVAVEFKMYLKRLFLDHFLTKMEETI